MNSAQLRSRGGLSLETMMGDFGSNLRLQRHNWERLPERGLLSLLPAFKSISMHSFLVLAAVSIVAATLMEIARYTVLPKPKAAAISSRRRDRS